MLRFLIDSNKNLGQSLTTETLDGVKRFMHSLPQEHNRRHEKSQQQWARDGWSQKVSSGLTTLVELNGKGTRE